MRKSPRDRRLNADFQSVQQLQRDSSIFSFEAAGHPTQRYRLTFQGAGFQRDSQERIKVTRHHEVLVELGAAYPRLVPNLAWQTPIFHPNISNNGVVCLGGYGTHWVPSLTLSEMCTMLWDMIRYKNFDTESPYNRDAALWAKQQTDFQFPIDQRSIRDRISSQKASPGVQPEIEVMLVTDRSKAGDTRKRSELPEVEIIETGIEIIENHSRPGADDGILFLD